MPPKGFATITSVLITLRNEVSALRLEVNETQKATQNDYKSLEQVVNITRDFSEVETLDHESRGANKQVSFTHIFVSTF